MKMLITRNFRTLDFEFQNKLRLKFNHLFDIILS
jgi:hypothetical protein